MNINVGLEGEYRLVVTRNGDEVHDTGWFKNLILNQGLDRLGDVTLFGGGGAFGGYIQVGTGTTPPNVADAGLVSRIGGVVSNGPFGQGLTESEGGNVSEGSPTYARTMTWKFVFGQGDLVGNLAEVGFGWSETGNSLFSRALITNQSGQPTTITTTSIDQVTVFYKLRLFPQLVATTGTTSIDGITTEWAMNSAYVSTGFLDGLFQLGQIYPGQFGLGTSWAYPKSSVAPHTTPVRFLHNFDGSTASTGAGTESVTLSNGADLSTTTAKFGSGSLDLRAGASYAEFGAPISLGERFTVEGWINLDTVGSTNRSVYINSNVSGGGASLFLTVSTDGRFRAGVNPAGGVDPDGATIIQSNANVITANTWHHVAVSKDQNGLRIYVDGTKVGEDLSMGGLVFVQGSYYPRFGDWNSPQAGTLGGFVDAFRVTHTALYTTNFAAPTAAPTALLSEHTLTAAQLLGPVTGGPGGVDTGLIDATFYSDSFPATVGVYTPGSYYRDYQIELGINIANHPYGLWGIRFFILPSHPSYNAGIPLQLVFNKPIMKDNTKRLVFVVRLSWGRV